MPTNPGLRLKVSIKESGKEIEKRILQAIASELRGGLLKASVRIERAVRNEFIKAITTSPEWQSLQGGKLHTEFGLSSAETKLGRILLMWIQSIYTHVDDIKVRGNQIKASFSLNMIRGDYSDVLGSPDAFQITEKGQSLAWLEWLLLHGDKIIVKKYDVSYGNPRRSRTGKAIMVKGKGKRWRVPPEFSGTIQNNFVTRAIDVISSKLEALISYELNKELL